jgi:hypothetical protein
MTTLDFTLDMLCQRDMIMLQCSNKCSIMEKGENMKARESHKTTAAEKGSDMLESFVPLYRKGIELIAELQKKTLSKTRSGQAPARRC